MPPKPKYRYYYDIVDPTASMVVEVFQVMIQSRRTQLKCKHNWMRRSISIWPSYGWDSVCNKCGKTARGVRYA